MEQNKFGNILANAQKLMLDEEFNAKVERSARAFAGGGGINSGGGSDLAAFEAQAFGYSTQEEKPIKLLESTINDAGIDINGAGANRLPKSIRESFAKRPPMSGDDIDSTPIGRITQTLRKTVQQPQRQVINEQRYAPQPQQYIPQGGGIDYSLIKSIIDESVRRNIDEIKNSLLNESVSMPAFRGMKIGDGNRIQFLDSKGNLYEGVLKLKRKAE